MKVYITRYALTSGIFTVEATVKDDMVSYTLGMSWQTQYAHGLGRDWHYTEESAIARVHNMRDKKIISHRKSMERLATMTFPITHH